MRSPWFLGLMLVAAMLAAIAWQEIRATAPDAAANSHSAAAAPGTNASGAPTATPVPGGTADAPRMEAMVATILARPLFEPSRRPPSVAAGPSAAAPGLPRLTGIILTPNGNSAIFASAETGRPMVLAEGERVNGFLVQSIAADRVVVVGGNGRHVLQPTFDKTAARPASAATADSRPEPPFARQSPTPAGGPGQPLGGASTPLRPTMPGLTGRPLGLIAQPDQGAGSNPPPFPSLAAPDNAQ